MSNWLRLFTISVGLLFMVACGSYYQRNLTFQNHFTTGQMEQANEDLDKGKKPATGHNRLLYFLNKGMVNRMLGNYDTSIEFFRQADFYIEDYQKNIGLEALSFVANPNVTPYEPEDFETVLVHYFQAKNYIDKGDFEGALVEIRRMNIRLNYINDKRKKKITYKNDAFANVVMGQVYEASGNYNDAFIAYRNALEVYRNQYKEAYAVGVPAQLKEDIIRSASKTGLNEERRQYEQEFGINYDKTADDGKGHLVFFWHNGLGPVKAEVAASFTLIPGAGGAVTFKNEELGFVFPFSAADMRGNEDVDWGKTRMIRVVFPKYVERVPMFNSATISVAGQKERLSLGEDINAIAFQDLRDRMLRELGKAVLRAALKQAAAEAARAKNEGVGAALSVLGALTESADTRNWQTLPHNIHYTRISLPEGEHTVNLELTGPRGARQAQQVKVTIRAGRTSFATFHSLDAVTKPLEGIYGQ